MGPGSYNVHTTGRRTRPTTCRRCPAPVAQSYCLSALPHRQHCRHPTETTSHLSITLSNQTNMCGVFLQSNVNFKPKFVLSHEIGHSLCRARGMKRIFDPVTALLLTTGKITFTSEPVLGYSILFYVLRPTSKYVLFLFFNKFYLSTTATTSTT